MEFIFTPYFFSKIWKLSCPHFSIESIIGISDSDASVMDGVKVPLERTAELLKWDVVGEVLIPGVFHEGDINGTDGCKQAAQLAEKF